MVWKRPIHRPGISALTLLLSCHLSFHLCIYSTSASKHLMMSLLVSFPTATLVFLASSPMQFVDAVVLACINWCALLYSGF